MPRHKPDSPAPTWTPNQVVASNLVRLRQRRGLTQGEVAQAPIGRSREGVE